MKKSFFLLVFTLISIISFSQPKDNATVWTFSFSKNDLKKGDVVDAIINVEIQEDWYIYSMYYDCAPLPTEINFNKNKDYELIGRVEPIEDSKKYDPIFECEYHYFKEKAKYLQKVKILNATPSPLTGAYNYQACSESQCIPYFDNKFSIAFTKKDNPIKSGIEKVPTHKIPKEISPIPITPIDYTPKESIVEECERKAGFSDVTVERFSKEKEKPKNLKALLVFAGISFLIGLGALLTPCVFPMIPMTVSYFTNSSKSKSGAIRKGVLYGFFIILIYTLLGTLVANLSGPSFANWLATSWITNLLFFAVFILFGLSFLGLFEITLPSKFVNNVDQKAEKGGVVGMFFMAFTLVLVSFSCTGPLVGSILIEAAGGEWKKPIAGMIGYSAAFAIPFALFAIFPSGLNRLPKSGGWLNSVKVVMGLLELALAFKFLSVADQAYHWNILSRDTFLIIWIAIFAVMFLYLIGKIVLPNDNKLEKISVSRLLFAISSLAFTIYLIPGLWGAPLNMLSGILPPKSTQNFDLLSPKPTTNSKVMYADQLHLPHGLNGYFDLREAICASKEQGKPIFLDVTGHGCVNCRQMEASVWSDSRVLDKLKNEFIVLALYADDRVIELPENEQYVKEDGSQVQMMRQLNNHFLQDKFAIHAQPYYLILEAKQNSNEIILKELTSPHEYDLNKSHFLSFLNSGLTNFTR